MMEEDQEEKSEKAASPIQNKIYAPVNINNSPNKDMVFTSDIYIQSMRDVEQNKLVSNQKEKT